ncbi:MAG: YjgN family protein, partial [Acidiferrobacterales bacterium]
MEDRQTETIATIPFEFTGKASEYFKIWVVNILLTILTLGIYSAWAKVRRKRYFYGNTLLQGSPFEYLAEPMQILKGRLIAFGIFVIYAIVNNFLPLVAGLLALVFLGLFPWLVIKAHMFNARYSSYRNIRFDFRANYGKALAVHIGLPILSILTLGLAYPAYMYHRSRFLVAHSGYGTAPFSFSATAGNFYIVYLKAILIFFAGTVLFAALAMALGM